MDYFIKFATVLSFIILYSFNVTANDQDIIFQSFINNNMELWKKVIDSMECIKNKTNNDKLKVLNYQYGGA